jgi:hypothetical protein
MIKAADSSIEAVRIAPQLALAQRMLVRRLFFCHLSIQKDPCLRTGGKQGSTNGLLLITACLLFPHASPRGNLAFRAL